MREVLLRPNQRPLLVALTVSLLCLLGGLALCWWARNNTFGFGIGVVVSLWAGLALAAAVGTLSRPILEHRDGHLVVRLGPTHPYRIPIEFVECFFRGQGPTEVRSGEGPEASNIVVRLAEAANDWRKQEVPARFGRWCDGYITINGLWCQPIDADLLREMNARLVQIHRQRKQQAPP